MTNPSDKELDDYLRRESPVSERYRTLDADDVPPALDVAVMAQARAAVAKPQRQRRPAWVRWGSPLALAASAVMIVAIVLEVGVQDELRVPAPQIQQQAATRAESEESESRVAPEPIERPVAGLNQDPSPFAADPSPVNAPQPAAPPPPLASKAERSRQTANVERQPAPPPAAASDNSARAAKLAESIEASRAAGLNGALQRREAEEVVVTGQYIQSTPQDAASPIAVIETQELKSNDQTRPAFGPRAPGAPRAVTADARASAVEPAQRYTTPESWLDAIRKLRADGKTAEADEQWRVFRLAYPNFEVRAGDAALPQSQR